MTFTALVHKDARREWRSREGLQAGLVLVGLFLLLDLFIFSDLAASAGAATAVVWTPVVFATAAVAGRGWTVEADRGTLEWLRSAPVSHLALAMSRTLVDGVLIALIAAATLALAGVLFGVAASPALWLLLGLGVVGLAVVGGLAGGLAAQAQARELLLPLLLIPVLAPLLMALVDGTLTVLTDPSASIRVPLLLAAGYDLISLGLGWLLWPILLEGD